MEGCRPSYGIAKLDSEETCFLVHTNEVERDEGHLLDVVFPVAQSCFFMQPEIALASLAHFAARRGAVKPGLHFYQVVRPHLKLVG